ncbi:UDP-galactose-lipid carrier transferase [Piscinibacter sakaiensis]|uniref:UDP-galactose-lipid carrier transferase n=1 Tax=Piscinibacter sakaiensis TaxID=1547922 RepID=A0A0K8NXW6_PISS1|nr:UDP-galactose-lipid carrier transferase [Piscinibacter sakaiensis]
MAKSSAPARTAAAPAAAERAVQARTAERAGIAPLDAADARRLARWQFAAAPGDGFSLRRLDPAAKPFSGGDKAADKARVEALARELDALQNLLYADRRHKLLVVLQGTDTSGKDGTIRGVFGQTSPLGVRTVAWKAPTETERAHDVLWRIHQQVPGAGEITIFNRSHYEDVLVPRVQGWVTMDQVRQRYAHINDFERMLAETGTRLVKCLLHISKDEQRARLQQRLDDPAKQWKFAPADLEVRRQWDDYQQAYADAIAATSTPWAPWTVVPADSKTHRNLMIALAVKQALLSMDLRFPPGDPALQGLRVT